MTTTTSTTSTTTTSTTTTSATTTSTTTTSTTTTSSSSTQSPAAPSLASAAFPASCPADDRKIVVDANGVAYQIFCTSDAQTVGDSSQVSRDVAITGTFNDCFGFCDTTPISGGANRCTGFTYAGTPNGAQGQGICYLKSANSYNVVNSGTNTQIAAVRQPDGSYIAITRTSSSFSSTPSPSPTKSAGGLPATCPADDRARVTTINGLSYQLLCATDVFAQAGGEEKIIAAANSFNDCFTSCDTTAFTSAGAGRCTGFTYVGAANGAGGGTCYLKSGTSYTQGSRGNDVVGAMRVYDVATTSSSSSLTSSSSAAVATAGPYSCSANDGQLVTDLGVQYEFRCGFQAQKAGTGGHIARITGQFTFNDCFRNCTNNIYDSPEGSGNFVPCTGVYYSFVSRTDGTGTCNYRGISPLSFGTPNVDFIAMIKREYYAYPTTTTATTITTTTTTTSSSSLQPSSVQTLTLTTVSFATVTTTTSFPVTTTAVSTQIQTVTSSYPVTTTQVSTAAGKHAPLVIY